MSDQGTYVLDNGEVLTILAQARGTVSIVGDAIDAGLCKGPTHKLGIRDWIYLLRDAAAQLETAIVKKEETQ